MSPKEPTQFRIAPETLAALREIKARDGLPITYQVEKALELWLESKGIIKAASRRVDARRKA